MSTPAYTAYEIPLTTSPQSLSVSLGGTLYQLVVKWNSISSNWNLDLSDNNGNLILGGIPLVCGLDLLQQFAYLDLGGSLYAQTDHSPNSPPTFTNLGVTGHLYFVVVE
jgi:hypothetical protein